MLGPVQAAVDIKSSMEEPGPELTTSSLMGKTEECKILTSSRALAEHREHIHSSEAFVGGTP
jgi:hypothetical protein